MADDSKQMDFETIIWELQRIEDIQQKQEEIQEELSETTEEVEEVKVSTEDVEKVIGIKESDKKKNVIDGDKLSTTLTTSEKKRYENIGKEFVAGAGKELENVRKAVQFKDAMSTVRNKFSEGVSKFKEGLKKAQKAGSFFGKLMIIIGLLGTIVMLFKDKILSAFPNLGKTVQDMFEGAKNGIGGIFNGILEFLKDKITEWGSSILAKVFAETIPSYVGTFFGVTLPESIVTLYLGILSSFSSSAMEMYNQHVEGHANDTFDSYGAAAVQETRNNGSGNTSTGQTQSQTAGGNGINYLTQAHEAYSRYLSSGESSNIGDLTTSLYSASAREMTKNENSRLLTYLSGLVEGNQDIRKLIESNAFDTNSFLSQIRDNQDDGKLTREEVFNAMINSIHDAGVRSGFKPSISVTNDGNRQISGDIRTLMNTISKNSEDQQTTIRGIIDERRRNERQRAEQEQNRLNERPVTTIEAGNVITEVLEESLTALVESITEFLSGNKITDALKTAFEELNNEFKTFFGDFNNFLQNGFSDLGDSIVKLVTFYNERGGNIIAQVQSIKNDIMQTYAGMLYSVSDLIKTETLNYLEQLRQPDRSIPSLIIPSTAISPNPNSFNDANFNAIVNVQLQQSDGNVGHLITEVISIDEQLVNLMKHSNTTMNEVIASFSKIYNLQACSQEYIDRKTTELSDRLDEHGGTLGSHDEKINENSAAIADLNSKLTRTETVYTSNSDATRFISSFFDNSRYA